MMDCGDTGVEMKTRSQSKAQATDSEVDFPPSVGDPLTKFIHVGEPSESVRSKFSNRLDSLPVLPETQPETVNTVVKDTVNELKNEMSDMFQGIVKEMVYSNNELVRSMLNDVHQIIDTSVNRSSNSRNRRTHISNMRHVSDSSSDDEITENRSTSMISGESVHTNSNINPNVLAHNKSTNLQFLLSQEKRHGKFGIIDLQM